LRSFDGCESLWIEVDLNKENIIIGVVYRHPHNVMNVFQESFMQTLHKLTVNKKIYMLWAGADTGGDAGDASPPPDLKRC